MILTGGRSVTFDKLFDKVYAFLAFKEGVWKKKALPNLNLARIIHSTCTIGSSVYVFGGHFMRELDSKLAPTKSIEVLKVHVRASGSISRIDKAWNEVEIPGFD